MKNLMLAFAIFNLLLAGCNNNKSLEKYFVNNTNNPNFIQVDVAPSILNLNTTQLTEEQKTALQSFNKMNVLAFKINDKNKAQFGQERTKVNEILKNEKYHQLMKFGSGKEVASISFVGEDEHISEFIIFGNKADKGFAIVRILGQDMNPSSIMTIVSAMQNSKMDIEQLIPIIEIMKQ